MSTSLYDLSVGSYLQTVDAAVNFMEKGAAHCRENGIDLADVVATSLYEDMSPFHFQAVCIAHHSIEAVRALESGEFLPPTNYAQTDYAGLQALVRGALEDLKALNAEDVNKSAGGRVLFKLGSNEIPFTTENFVLSFSLPNFYFHTTTAYDILRMTGVPLGKRDFLGNMRMG